MYTPVMAIPPGEDDFILTGYCTDKCTQLVSACPLQPGCTSEEKACPWLFPGSRQHQPPGSQIPSLKLTVRQCWKEKSAVYNKQRAAGWDVLTPPGSSSPGEPSAPAPWGTIPRKLTAELAVSQWCFPSQRWENWLLLAGSLPRALSKMVPKGPPCSLREVLVRVSVGPTHKESSVSPLTRAGKEAGSGSAAPAALEHWFGSSEGLSLCKELTEMLFQGYSDPLNPV